MMTNSELRRTARRHLEGRWGDLVLVTFLYYIISSALSFPFQLGMDESIWKAFPIPFEWKAPVISGGCVLLFLLLPLQWGYQVTFLRAWREEPADIATLFHGYGDFWRIFSTMFLQQLYILLWTLLLIVPGVVKALSYAMTPYILRDHPELSRRAAIHLSREIMAGNKGRLLLLWLSFLGWAVLALFTCGIGFLWLAPYIGVSEAGFYEDVMHQYRQRIGEEEVEPAEDDAAQNPADGAPE